MELKDGILELQEKDAVKVAVPVGKNLNFLIMEVRFGKLFISGSASLIDKIVGVGMSQKVCG